MIDPKGTIGLVHKEKLLRWTFPSVLGPVIEIPHPSNTERLADSSFAPSQLGVILTMGLTCPLLSHQHTLRQVTALQSDSSPFPALLLLFGVCRQLLKEPSMKLFLLLKDGSIGNQISLARMYINLIIGLAVHGMSGQNWPRWPQQKLSLPSFQSAHAVYRECDVAGFILK